MDYDHQKIRVFQVSVPGTLVKLLLACVFWTWVYLHSNLQCVRNYTQVFGGWLAGL